MYIWILGRAVPSHYNGMHGSFEFEQAQMIRKRGYKVVYIALSIFPRTILKWKDLGRKKKIVDGIITYNVYLPFGFTSIGRKLVRGIIEKKLFSKVKNENGLPDIVHVHFPSMWTSDSFVEFNRMGIRIVATEHWTEVLKKNVNTYIIENLKWFVNNSKVFICVGEPLKQSVIDLVGEKEANDKIVVVPNIVNEYFCYHPRKVNYNSFVFCAVGRLVECKRFDLLINAFTEAFFENKNVILKIVGGGKKMNKLKSQIQKLHMSNRIVLTGTKTREETAIEVSNCDVLVCSSDLETFGVPVIEAMACGKPVVTTDVFAIPSIIDQNVGILVEKDNYEQMLKAMKQIYNNRCQYDDAAIAKKAQALFGEKAVIGKLISIYES